MKIFKDKDGYVTIVFNKDEKPDVTIVHDRGTGNITNFFGNKVPRYVYHVASAKGDSGYSSTTDDFSELKEQTKYILKKSKSQGTL